MIEAKRKPFMFRRTIWAMILFTVMLSSCATLEQIIKKPTATLRDMNIAEADLTQAKAMFNFNVANPNAINIRASRITYDLKLDGQNFIAGELDQGIMLAGSSTSVLSIPVKIKYLDFFDSLAQMWKNKSVKYDITGGFSVGPFRIPYDAKGAFDLPKMPKFSMESIRIENFSLSGARLNCRLKMDNPNAFDLLFKRLEYSLNLGGTSFAKANALPQGPIAGNGQSFMDFGFDVSFAQLGMSAYQLLQGNKSDFKLDGGMVMDSDDGKESIVPFNLAGQVPLLK